MSVSEGQLSLTDVLDAPAQEPTPVVASPEREITSTEEQLAAVAARHHDAFLEAGAGTGKTAVLVDRYCEAVIDDGVEVDHLLAFTFTERAAAEMRARVRRALTRRSREVRASGDGQRGDEL